MTEYRVIPVELGADLFYKEKKKQVEYKSSKAKRKAKTMADPFAAILQNQSRLNRSLVYTFDSTSSRHSL